MSEPKSLTSVLKTALEKTNLANIASFFLVIGMMYYAIRTNNEEIIKWVGGASIGYLFGKASG